MAIGLWRNQSPEQCSQIIDGAVQGVRLTRLLDLAARTWLRLHLERLVSYDLPGPPAEAHERLVACQRVRIRRAGAMVPVAQLLRPRPPAMIPGDIPTSPEQNRGWYTFTSHSALPWIPDPHPRMISMRQERGLSRFLSRWWPDLLASCTPRERDEPAGMLGHIVDFLEATGRVIDRRTSPARLVEDMAHWVVDLGRARRLPSYLPLQTHGLTQWSGTEGTIEPLTTVAQLVEESQTMRHCVASMAARGVAGHAVYLHAEIHDEPLTVEVRPGPDGRFRITEAKGRDNRGLDAREREALAGWLDELNARRGACGEGGSA